MNRHQEVGKFLDSSKVIRPRDAWTVAKISCPVPVPAPDDVTFAAYTGPDAQGTPASPIKGTRPVRLKIGAADNRHLMDSS